MSTLHASVASHALCVLLALSAAACLDGQDASSESVAPPPQASSATGPAASAPDAASSARAKSARPAAQGLDPLQDLEDLAPGASPTWPAPPPSADGCPIVLRAVRTREDVVLWAYGAPAGAAGASYRARLADANGVIREVQAGGTPLSHAAPGAWYRLARLMGGAEFAQAQAQVSLVQADGGAALWSPSIEHRGEWRHTLPKAPTKVDEASKLGLSLVGVERFDTGDRKETVLVAALYNLGAQPVTRVEFEVVPRGASGPLAPIGGVWLPMGGDLSIPSIAPGKHAVVRFDTEGLVDGLTAVTDFDWKVGKVER